MKRNKNGMGDDEMMLDFRQDDAGEGAPVSPQGNDVMSTASSGMVGESIGSTNVDTPAGAPPLEPADGNSAPTKPLSWVAAVLTIIIVVLVLAALMFMPNGLGPVDTAQGKSGQAKEVRQTELTAYCPGRMSLPDNGKYGDGQFQTTEGDITSSSRYGAFGSAYRVSIGKIKDGTESESTDLKGRASGDGLTAKALAGDVNDGSRVLTAKLLDAKAGTGTASAVASWATQGDLAGASAAACVVPALEQDFLIGSTDEGSTHQLVAANPSSKATSLVIRAWGTKSGNPIALSTGSTLTVGAHGEASVDLAAGAPHEEGLYVSVTSKETPVAAVVRSVSMDGLQSKGSDYAVPLDEANRESLIAGVNSGDQVKLLATAEQAADLNVSWVTGSGLEDKQHVQVSRGKVSISDLGQAPDGALGIRVESSAPVHVQAEVSRTNGAHADFAYLPALAQTGHSALALPSGASGNLTVVNASGEKQSVHVTGYDGDGKRVGAKDVSLAGHAASSLDPADVGGAVLFTMTGSDHVVWGARLRFDSVDAANLADVAFVGPSSLEPHSMKVWAEPSQTVVR